MKEYLTKVAGANDFELHPCVIDVGVSKHGLKIRYLHNYVFGVCTECGEVRDDTPTNK